MLPSLAAMPILPHERLGVEGGGAFRIDGGRPSGCPVKVSYSYNTAFQSKESSPCSNVPMLCPLCPKQAPAIWRYNLEQHFIEYHPSAMKIEEYRKLRTLDPIEIERVTAKWEDRHRVTVKRPRGRRSSEQCWCCSLHC
jgi:hypothetical protein